MRQRLPLLVGMVLMALALVATIGLIALSIAASPPPLPTLAQAGPSQLSARLGAGDVAVEIPLDPLASVGDTLRPGDHIDLYALFPPGASGGASATSRILLRDWVVLDASRQGDSEALTLEMPPEQALTIQSATQGGARPFALLHAAGGFTNPTPLDSFGDTDLPAWIAQGGGS